MKNPPGHAFELEQAIHLVGGTEATVNTAWNMAYWPGAIAVLCRDDIPAVTMMPRIASRITTIFHRILQAHHADTADSVKTMLEVLEEAFAHARARLHNRRHPALAVAAAEQRSVGTSGLPTSHIRHRLLAAAGPSARVKGVETNAVVAWAGFVRLQTAAACEESLSDYFGIRVQLVKPRSLLARAACRIGPLDAQQFARFRPGTEHLRQLLQAIGVFLGPNAGVELTIVILRDEVPVNSEFLRRLDKAPTENVEVWLSPGRCSRLRNGAKGGLVS